MEKTQWQTWKKQPETQEVFLFLEQLKRKILEAWANGSYTTESGDGTLQANAKAIGNVQALDEILTLTYEDMYDE